jgi:hypothetical protein
VAEAPTWLRHTLEEIVGQIRRLLDVSGCAFQVVDFEAGLISPQRRGSPATRRARR